MLVKEAPAIKSIFCLDIKLVTWYFSHFIMFMQAGMAMFSFICITQNTNVSEEIFTVFFNRLLYLWSYQWHYSFCSYNVSVSNSATSYHVNNYIFSQKHKKVIRSTRLNNHKCTVEMSSVSECAVIWYREQHFILPNTLLIIDSAKLQKIGEMSKVIRKIQNEL